MCLISKIPMSINSEAIIIAENNVEFWKSPEMKGAQGTNILTTDSQDQTRTRGGQIQLCFMQVREHYHNSDFSDL